MRKLAVLFILTFAFTNLSVALDIKTTIIGEWKVTKIQRKGKKLNSSDPMAQFKNTIVVFYKNNKLLLKAGKSELPGKWSVKNKKLRFLGSKYGLDVHFHSRNRMIVHYVKDDVKIYLKRLK
ncbi:MAG TPA: hypothetical protein ENI73_03590 [Spirochaetes bacterium]|nr:hypothetical protein [Spirochaetota bacterium]